MNLNRASLIGYLCKEGKSRAIPDGTLVTTRTLLLPKNFLSKEGEWEPGFLSLTGSGRLAEKLHRLPAKRQVAVSGRLETFSWKEGEKTHSRVILRLTDIEDLLLDNRDEEPLDLQTHPFEGEWREEENE